MEITRLLYNSSGHFTVGRLPPSEGAPPATSLVRLALKVLSQVQREGESIRCSPMLSVLPPYSYKHPHEPSWPLDGDLIGVFHLVGHILRVVVWCHGTR